MFVIVTFVLPWKRNNYLQWRPTLQDLEKSSVQRVSYCNRPMSNCKLCYRTRNRGIKIARPESVYYNILWHIDEGLQILH